jgi:hypothetical protein
MGSLRGFRSVLGLLAVVVALTVTGYVAGARVRASQVDAVSRRVAPSPGTAYLAPAAPDLVTPDVPTSGSGRFVPASGGSPAVGQGRIWRYEVAVEDGAGEAPEEFAAIVEQTLADPRGWTAGHQWGFQRVAAGPSDFTVHLATPTTTKQMCDRYGVDTGGEVSCRGGRNVVINLRRWRLAVPWYADALEEYRYMVINHEVGHFLGHGHVDCPRAGAPAPVMQTQTLGLRGCLRNPWPYPDRSTFVTGPSAAR